MTTAQGLLLALAIVIHILEMFMEFQDIEIEQRNSISFFQLFLSAYFAD